MNKRVVAAEKIVKSLGLEVKSIGDICDDENLDGTISLNNGYEIQVGYDYFSINKFTPIPNDTEIEFGDEIKTQKALKEELEKLKPAIVA